MIKCFRGDTNRYRMSDQWEPLSDIDINMREIYTQSHLKLLRHPHIDGLVQEKRNSIANALELRLFLHQPIDISDRSSNFTDWP